MSEDAPLAEIHGMGVVHEVLRQANRATGRLQASIRNLS
jgi:hypothetical protein